MKSKVVEITETFHGHHLVRLANGHSFSVHRGEPLPKVGDEYVTDHGPRGGIRHTRVKEAAE